MSHITLVLWQWSSNHNTKCESMEISLEGEESIGIGTIGGFKKQQNINCNGYPKWKLILEVLRNYSVMFDF